jgi:hypothetical protein
LGGCFALEIGAGAAAAKFTGETALHRAAPDILVVTPNEDIVDRAASEAGIGTDPVAFARRRGAVGDIVLDAAVLTRFASRSAGTTHAGRDRPITTDERGWVVALIAAALPAVTTALGPTTGGVATFVAAAIAPRIAIVGRAAVAEHRCVIAADIGGDIEEPSAADKRFRIEADAIAAFLPIGTALLDSRPIAEVVCRLPASARLVRGAAKLLPITGSNAAGAVAAFRMPRLRSGNRRSGATIGAAIIESRRATTAGRTGNLLAGACRGLGRGRRPAGGLGIVFQQCAAGDGHSAEAEHPLQQIAPVGSRGKRFDEGIEPAIIHLRLSR